MLFGNKFFHFKLHSVLDVRRPLALHGECVCLCVCVCHSRDGDDGRLGYCQSAAAPANVVETREALLAASLPALGGSVSLAQRIESSLADPLGGDLDEPNKIHQAAGTRLCLEDFLGQLKRLAWHRFGQADLFFLNERDPQTLMT